MANCQYTCEDLRPTLLHEDLQYPPVGLFRICYRGSNNGFLAVYRVNDILDLQPFCIQLEQVHNDWSLWKYQCILSVNGDNQSAYRRDDRRFALATTVGSSNENIEKDSPYGNLQSGWPVSSFGFCTISLD